MGVRVSPCGTGAKYVTDYPDEWDDPTLEDAMDGLYTAHLYCLENGWDELASDIFDQYQAVGELSIEEDN